MLNRTARATALLLMAVSLCLVCCHQNRCAADEPVENSPVADAAEIGDWPTVSALLQKGNSPNIAQPDGMTALHWAVSHKQLDAVTTLLAAEANANAATEYDITPLSLACMQGDPAIVAKLLDAGAVVDARMPGGETPLMIASRQGNPQVIRHLLKHKADVNAIERSHQTALMWAAAAGNTEAVAVLLEAKADAGATTRMGFTPMFFAARNGHLEVCRQLLQAGVDVNAVITPRQKGARAPRNGTSALLFAVESGHYELALMLVEQGANPNDQRNGFTPLHVLSWVRKPARGENADGDPPPRGSGKLTDLQFAAALVQAGADVNAKLKRGNGGKAKLNPKGSTPCLYAARTADLQLLSTLVKLGGNPLTPNAEGCTPLMAAAGVGVRAVGEEAGSEAEVLETLKFLLDHGADVNDFDKNNETAMHGAAYRNYPLVVEFLSQQGAKPAVWNRKNSFGSTPVQIAQGKRPGSFKPSPETVAELRNAMTTK